MHSSRSSSTLTSTAIRPISYNDTPEGKQAPVWDQAHAREDWNRKLADFKKKVKDLSIHNNVTQAHWQALHLYTSCTAFTCTLMLHARHLLTLSCTTHGTRTAFTCTFTLHARHLLTLLCTTPGTFLHPHTPRGAACIPIAHIMQPVVPCVQSY
jgi:hypothetical protein